MVHTNSQVIVYGTEVRLVSLTTGLVCRKGWSRACEAVSLFFGWTTSSFFICKWEPIITMELLHITIHYYNSWIECVRIDQILWLILSN